MKDIENETVAALAFRLLKRVPSRDWLIDEFTDCKSKCCAIGHYTRLTSENPQDYNVSNCSDVARAGCRYPSLRYQSELYLYGDGVAGVNNGDDLRYRQRTAKSRTMALLKDMMKAGY